MDARQVTSHSPGTHSCSCCVFPAEADAAADDNEEQEDTEEQDEEKMKTSDEVSGDGTS